MCGIFGFNWSDDRLLNKMSQTLAHRGPDAFGQYLDSQISLGHRRLAIIDLSKEGHQPIYNDDKSLLIIYNGELYNYKVLRDKLKKKYTFRTKTDTEVILRAYEEYGLQCLHQFEGIFAFGIYHTKEKKLFLARDQLGVKPLFYYYQDHKFIFASETKAILDAPIEASLSRSALALYLRYRYVPGEETLFQDIFKLPPAHYLTLDLNTGRLKKAKYWYLHDRSEGRSEQYYIDTLKKQLLNTVTDQMVADVPVGIYLSGGVDSSLVAALTCQNVPAKKVKTYSVGFGEKYQDELKFARLVADHLGTDHTEYILDESRVLSEFDDLGWLYDEPVAEGGAIPNYFLSKHVKKEVTVVLAGEGGDEVFGGYDYYDLFNRINQFNNNVPLAMRKLAKKFIPEKYQILLNTTRGNFDFLHQNFVMRYFTDSEISALVGRQPPSVQLNMQGDQIENYFNFVQYLDIKTQLADCFNTKFDRTTMAHSMEGRVPLQSPSLVQLAFSIPPHLKFNTGQEKYILKKVANDFLPPEITTRKKQGYATPMEGWVRHVFKETIIRDLQQSRLVNDGVIQPEPVTHIINHYDSYNHLKIWVLFALERWYRLYAQFLSMPVPKPKLQKNIAGHHPVNQPTPDSSLSEYYNNHYLETSQSAIVNNPRVYRYFGLISQKAYFKDIDVDQDNRILEFGIGLGQNIYFFKHAYGYDISEFSKQFCRSKGITMFDTLDDINDNSFDIILSAHCLEHLPNPLDNLQFLYKKLKKNGRLVVVLPFETHELKPPSGSWQPDIDNHLYVWNFRTINNLLTYAGLKVLSNTYNTVAGYDWLSKLNFINDDLYFKIITFLGQFSFLKPRKELRIVASKE